MEFTKPGKYLIINKSTTFAHFCYPYVNLLDLVSFLHKSKQLLFLSKKENFGKKAKQKKHMPTYS